MLPIVAVVVWGSIVQGAFLAVILHPEGKAMDNPYRSDKNKA